MPEYVLRGMGPPHPKQQEAHDLLVSPSEHVKHIDIMAGRGFGKSEFAIWLAFEIMRLFPGCTGLFLEPDMKRINRVLLKKWRKMVPRALYTINKGERCITLLNGSELHYAPRRVSGNKESADDDGRGPDVDFIIDDEAAIGCSYEMYINNMGAIRAGKTPCPFYLTISTFKYGDYELLIDSPTHTTVIGRTADNVYLPKNYERDLRDAMPTEVSKIELDSERGVQEGRIWTNFIMEPWPKGNIMQGYRFRHGEPWYLVMDLGNHANYSIYQAPDPVHPITGQRGLMGGKLWCLVEEWLSNNDVGSKTGQGGLDGILPDIIDRYCQGDPVMNKPVCVYLGHDSNTKGTIVAQSAVSIFAKLGWDWRYPAGPLSSQDIQRTHLSNMMWEKRFVVAANKNYREEWAVSKQFFGEGKKRGIFEVIKRDVYPKTGDAVFEKDKTSGKNPKTSIEDDRDSAKYGAICHIHPDTYDAEYFLRKMRNDKQWDF